MKNTEEKMPRKLLHGESHCRWCSKPSRRAWKMEDGLCLACRREQMASFRRRRVVL